MFLGVAWMGEEVLERKKERIRRRNVYSYRLACVTMAGCIPGGLGVTITKKNIQFLLNFNNSIGKQLSGSNSHIFIVIITICTCLRINTITFSISSIKFNGRRSPKGSHSGQQ